MRVCVFDFPVIRTGRLFSSLLRGGGGGSTTTTTAMMMRRVLPALKLTEFALIIQGPFLPRPHNSPCSWNGNESTWLANTSPPLHAHTLSLFFFCNEHCTVISYEQAQSCPLKAEKNKPRTPAAHSKRLLLILSPHAPLSLFQNVKGEG